LPIGIFAKNIDVRKTMHIRNDFRGEANMKIMFCFVLSEQKVMHGPVLIIGVIMLAWTSLSVIVIVIVVYVCDTFVSLIGLRH
jgi:hypothetical protein